MTLRQFKQRLNFAASRKILNRVGKIKKRSKSTGNIVQKYIIITLLLLSSLSIAQNIGRGSEPNPDWLINSTSFKSEIKVEKHKLELSNGLISRSILLKSNAATISLKHLITGEEFIRSVRPEAQIEVDGMSFNIGGLTGQPVHNYLLPQWLDEMQADPSSFKFVGYKTGPTKERFAWKKRLKWMPQDLPWPPPGKMLTLKFRADDQSIRSVLTRTANDSERRLLLEDHFSELSENWTLYASPGHPRNSFINEGKPGEIMALSHHAVFAEQRWPAEGTITICRIDPGTDNSLA